MVRLAKGRFILCLGLLTVMCAIEAAAVTPLKYHTHMVALVEATADDISITKIPTLDTNKFMRTSSREESMVLIPVQVIKLRIDSVLKYRVSDIYQNDSDWDFQLKQGLSISLSNPWADQKLPFKKGDVIRTSIRLVSTEQVYNPAAKHNQWFNPSGDWSEVNTQPRRPFRGIEIISSN